MPSFFFFDLAHVPGIGCRTSQWLFGIQETAESYYCWCEMTCEGVHYDYQASYVQMYLNIFLREAVTSIIMVVGGSGGSK